MPHPPFAVELTAGAEADLEAIFDYLSAARDIQDAARFLDRIVEKLETLEHFPERGNVPKELEALGISEFRQILHGSYRLIYRIIDRRVIVSIIADGRRDMQALLERRLLGR